MSRQVHGRKPRAQASPLDLFVLALVAQGNNTVYALQEKAGISQGSAIPTLRWLEQEGLVKKAKSGSRGKQEFRVTSTGEARLRGMSEFEQYQTGLDLLAILRLIALSAKHEKLTPPDSLIGRALRDRRQSLRRITRAHLSRTNWHDTAQSYRSMKQVADRARLAAEITALEHIAKALPRGTRMR
jgi:DNA-binding PadR family transcriptional regulator